MGSVTVNGYQKDSLEVIRGNTQSDIIDGVGAAYVLSDANLGHLFEGVLGDRLMNIEEALEAISFIAFPDTAEGIFLDHAVSITGFTRQPATNSSAVCVAWGTSSTVIGKGTIIAVKVAGDFFEADSDTLLGPIGTLSVGAGDLASVGTLATVTYPAHGFSDGDYVFINGADQTEYNSQLTNEVQEPLIVKNATAGTFDYDFAGSATSPATGTITAVEGTLLGLVASEVGPVQALAGNLADIKNPISGFDGIWNYDATLGTFIETDSELRARRKANLFQLAGGTAESIKGKLLNISGVTSVVVFENDTGLYVGLQTPYSVQCFVTGGADQDIIDSIGGQGKSAGVATYGTESGIYVDSEGNNHTIYFSRLVEVTIYIDTTIVQNTIAEDGPVFDAINGPTDIKNAIAAYGDTLEAGADVWENQIRAAIGSIAGVKSITTLLIDTITPPVSTGNVTIISTNVANIDTSNIDVTVT